jgi:hypothetical protein
MIFPLFRLLELDTYVMAPEPISATYFLNPSLQLPIHWVPGALSRGVKRPAREDDHSNYCRGQEYVVDLYVHSPVRLHGAMFN